MINLVLIGTLLIIIGSAIHYIGKEKKRGIKCIGCPAAGKCLSQNTRKTGVCSGCSSHINL